MLMKTAKIKLFYLMMILIVSCPVNGAAEIIYLKNNDKVTGMIVSQDDLSIVISTESMGLVTIQRSFVTRIKGEDLEETPPAAMRSESKNIAKKDDEENEIEWEREFSVGYNAARGNTENDELSTKVMLRRNNPRVNEYTVKGNVYISRTNNQTDAQKWYGAGRYAYSYGSTKKWYNFYQLEVDHDRFSNIASRWVPSMGVGYWVSDALPAKLLIEAAAGYEYTDFRRGDSSEGEIVLIPRLYFEKELFENLVLTQNVMFYSTMEDFGQYRVRFETDLTSRINHRISLRLSLTDEYNSDPAINAKHNDLRIVSSLVYAF